MKRLYWRPNKVSKKGLLAICVAALTGLALVKQSPIERVDRYRATKLAAAQQAAALFDTLKQERLRRGLPIESSIDPTHSGLVGTAMSAVTSRPGDLRSKQTSVNPNFAAAIVEMLVEGGVESCDAVAVGWSGSFPALNVAVCAALEQLQVRPLIIASAASSQYGANLPQWMWLDMEHHLREQSLIGCRSAAVTIGGGADRGLGMSNEALTEIERLAQRTAVPLMRSSDSSEAVRQRIALYRQLAAGRPIKAYINVGGGMASTGGEKGRHVFQAGLNRNPSRGAAQLDCVMGHFAQDGVPVIHLNQTKLLATSLGFPVAPTRPPALGVGTPFRHQVPNRPLAVLVVAAILAGLRVCVWNGRAQSKLARWLDVFRIRPTVMLHRVDETASEPQWMV
jgi:poly-gamma-glutamate system protein